MHEVDLVLTLAGGLTAALVCGVITNWLGLSPLVGYLIGGMLVGPHTPGFVANQTLADQLAEIGVILLMFGIGLHFHLEDLLAVKRIAILGALGQVAIATVLGGLIGAQAGWGWEGALIFGLAMAVASTVVMLRLLEGQQAIRSPAGRIAIGWLVVEDLLTVLALVLLPGLANRAGGSELALGLGLTVVKIIVMILLVYVGGKRLIPWILARADGAGSGEIYTLTILVLALGVAVGSAKVFGVSMALGAFLAGMVVGQTDHGARAAAQAMPMRDAFSVLFFVSIGMLLDPHILVEAPVLVLGVLAVILAAKPLAALFILALLGQPLAIGLRVAAALAQIGEFSFMLTGLGRELGLLDAQASSILVAASIISITLNPLLYRLATMVTPMIKAGANAENVLPRPNTPP